MGEDKVGYNFGLLLRWLALLLRIVLAVLAAPSHSNRTLQTLNRPQTR